MRAIRLHATRSMMAQGCEGLAFVVFGRLTFALANDSGLKAKLPMTILVLGLVIFLGLHSTRIVSESGRERAIARIGEGPWKGIYSALSVIGFVLIVWGFARARYDAPQLWTPPAGARHITMLLMLVALISVRGLSLQAKPYCGHHPSSDAVVCAVVERGPPVRQRLGGGSSAVRRLPRLVGCGSRKLIRPRPAERRRLS